MMILVSLLIVALFVLPDYYIWLEFINGNTDTLWSLLYWLPTAAAILLMIIAAVGVYNISRIRIFFGLFTCIAVPKLLFTISSLIGLVIHHLTYDSTDLPNIIGITLAIISCGLFTYGFVFGWRMLKVRDIKIESPDLPRVFDGYKILQITDLHLGTFENHKKLIRSVVVKVRSLHPDLIVFTGDIVNADAKEIEPYIEILSNLKAPDGVLSILGNHDYCKYSRENTTIPRLKKNIEAVKNIEAQMGWDLLLNESRKISRGEYNIYILGVENDSVPPFPSYGNLKKTIKGVPKEAFKVLLSHDPTHWRREVLPKTNIQLTLSGHTHGMQLKIGRLSPSRLAFREWGGIYNEGMQTLCVSLGIGGTVPFRLGAWPEINLVTLNTIMVKNDTEK